MFSSSQEHWKFQTEFQMIARQKNAPMPTFRHFGSGSCAKFTCLARKRSWLLSGNDPRDNRENQASWKRQS